jgi:hypothetical protein
MAVNSFRVPVQSDLVQVSGWSGEVPKPILEESPRDILYDGGDMNRFS